MLQYVIGATDLQSACFYGRDGCNRWEDGYFEEGVVPDQEMCVGGGGVGAGVGGGSDAFVGGGGDNSFEGGIDAFVGGGGVVGGGGDDSVEGGVGGVVGSGGDDSDRDEEVRDTDF